MNRKDKLIEIAKRRVNNSTGAAREKNLAHLQSLQVEQLPVAPTPAPTPEPTKPTDPRTTEERSESLVDGMFQDAQDAEQKYLGETVSSSSLDEHLKKQIEKSNRIAAQQKKSLEAQQRSEDAAVRRERNSIGSQEVNVSQQLSNHRNGPLSSANVDAISAFRTEAERRRNELSQDAQLAKEARDEAKLQLEEARNANNADAVREAQILLDNAELEVKRVDSEYFNSLSVLSQEQRANFSMFQSMINTGTVLTDEGIAGFAEQFGLPYLEMKSFYDGAQAIRDDNVLTIEEKNAALAELQYDLDRKLKGIESEEAKKVDEYLKLVQSGNFTEQELSTFSTMMGIPDHKNPIFMAEQKIREAQAEIAKLEANGTPREGTKQWFEREMLKNELALQELEMNELRGISNVGRLGMPVPKIQTNVSSSLGRGVVTAYGSSLWGDGLDFVLEGGKEAKVNIPFGFEVISIDEETGFGKRVKLKNLSDGREAWFSHLDSVDVQEGQIYTAGTSIGNQGNTGDTLGETGIHLDITMPDGNGYLSPQDVASYFGVGQETGEQLGLALDSIKFGSVDARQNAEGRLKSLIQKGDLDMAKEYLITQIRNNAKSSQQDTLDGKANTIKALEDIQRKLNKFEAKGGDTGVFTGLTEKGLQKGGLTSDPDLADISNQIAIAIVDYRKAVSGAAFTESEAKAYDAIFPSTGKTAELNKVKIDSLIERLQGNRDNFYKANIGESLYEVLFSETEEKITESLNSDPDTIADKYLNQSSVDELLNEYNL